MLGRVAAGEDIGTVDPPGKLNGNYAHIHIHIKSDYWDKGINLPFAEMHQTRFQCAPDMPAKDGFNQYSGTRLTRCGGVDCPQTKTKGDANCSGKVEITDLSILAESWLWRGTGLPADFNSDGVINISDLGILAQHWQMWVASATNMSTASIADKETEAGTNAAAMAVNTNPVRVSFARKEYDITGDESIKVNIILDSNQKYVGAEMLLQYSQDLLQFEDKGMDDDLSCISINAENPSVTNFKFGDPRYYKAEDNSSTGLVKVVRAVEKPFDTLPSGRLCAATFHFRPKTSTPATGFISFATMGDLWKVGGSGIIFDHQFDPSGTVTVNIAGGAVPAAPKPSDGVAKGLFFEGQNLTLVWESAANAAEYKVELVNENGVRRESGWQKDRAWFINTPPPGSYTWHVKARNWKGESDWSSDVSFTISLNPPSDLRATVLDCDKVSLTWTDNSNAEMAYVVQRQFRTIARLSPNTRTYQDTGLTPNSKYQYFVVAVPGENGLGPSPLAADGPATITTPQCGSSGLQDHLYLPLVAK